MENIQKIAPQNLEAEQGVLGSMMIEPAAIDRIASILSAEMLYRPTHQLVYSTLVRMHTKGAEIDLITLQDELRTREVLEDSGGTEYLMALVESVPTAANAEYYAEIIREKHILRRQAEIGRELQERIDRNGSDARENMAWLAQQVDELNTKRGTGIVHVRDMLGSYWDALAAHQDKVGLDGYTTGFSALDVATGGFGPPLFVVLKGARGKGKTQIMIQTAVHCLRAGKAAAIFSMDTPEATMLDRFLAHLTGINSFRVKRPRGEDWDKLSTAVAWLYNAGLYIFDDSHPGGQAGASVADVGSMCRSLIAGGADLGFVGIDYAEQLRPERDLAGREQELSRMAQGLRKLRDSLGTTIYLLSQVNEQGGERWSRGIGNACDLLLSWTVRDVKDGRGNGRLWSEKNRLGPDRTVSCVFDFGCSRIRELSLDHSDPSYPPSWPWWYTPAPEPESVDNDEF